MCEKDSDGFVPIFEEKDLNEGEITSVQEQNPELPILLIKIGSEVFAIGDQCPHWGLPLRDVWLHRYEDTDKFGWSIVCPQHGMRFSLKTGENVEDLLGGGDGSSYKLKTYDCKIKDGKICVRM